MSQKPLRFFGNERPPPGRSEVAEEAPPPAIEIPVDLLLADEKMSRIWEPERADKFRPILYQAVHQLLASGEVAAVLQYLRYFNHELDKDIVEKKHRDFWSWIVELFSTIFAKVATEVATFFLGPKP